MTRLISTYATNPFATVDDTINLQATTYDPSQPLNYYSVGARNLKRRHRDVGGLISVEDLVAALPAWLPMACAILLSVMLVILLGFGWVFVTHWVHVGLNRAAGVAAASDAGSALAPGHGMMTKIQVRAIAEALDAAAIAVERS